MKSVEDRHFYSPITTTSRRYMQPLSGTMVSSITKEDEELGVESQEEKRAKCAYNSTVRTDADLPSPPANINTCVSPVVSRDMENLPAEKRIEKECFGMKPRYLRYNLWMPDADPKMTAADWTEVARPLPKPPPSKFLNLPACAMLEERPELFDIVTPVNVDALQHLTATHPSRPFVESVIEGLRCGFWPWARTDKEGYPVTLDASKPICLDEEKQLFVLTQLEHERGLGRVSEPFGSNLLPEMYCMPHYVVPKPHSNSWRLVNDLSAGSFLPNSMVDHECVTGYPLDNLSHFGELLLRKRRENPGVSFVAWKSDVSEAYRICPMHQLWQLKQIVKVRDEYVVDRVNMFGGSSSGPIFISVNTLVAWIADRERDIEDLVYVDDSFGVEEEGYVVLYVPYGVELPLQQTCLLELWDELGVPHKQKKQVHGSQLTILGIEIDVNNLTFTLPQESKDRLSKELADWCQRGVRRKVKEWQQLAGWINWVLNVYPLLRLALNNVYDKIKGKEQEARVWANDAIREDLE
jgi:hypothetical protein